MHLWAIQWVARLLLLTKVCANIHIGGALNIFSYFGDLGTLVNVNPYLERNWFFDGGSVDVFEEVFETRSPIIIEGDSVFNGDFDLELCPTLSDLYKAFFKTYKIDRSEKPWRAFVGGWTNTAIARYFGLNSSFVTKTHSYVLVRLVRKHEQVNLNPHVGLHLNNWTTERMARLVPGQVGTVLEFIRVSGSHFVTSYTTGDSLYQVFVFTPAVFEQIHNSLFSRDQQQTFNFFSPFYAQHIGKILSLSGNASLEDWAARNLHTHILMFNFPNLIKLRSDTEYLHYLNDILGNDALLSVELKSITSLVEDDIKRIWFEEVLDNNLNLWELNV